MVCPPNRLEIPWEDEFKSHGSRAVSASRVENGPCHVQAFRPVANQPILIITGEESGECQTSLCGAPCREELECSSQTKCCPVARHYQPDIWVNWNILWEPGVLLGKQQKQKGSKVLMFIGRNEGLIPALSDGPRFGSSSESRAGRTKTTNRKAWIKFPFDQPPVGRTSYLAVMFRNQIKAQKRWGSRMNGNDPLIVI